MKFIILAAGLGKRLGRNLPKSLVQLSNGKTILEHQLENIIHFYPMDNVVIITGYKKELIKELFPDLKQIINFQYETTNTAKSLLMGLTEIEEDFIFMNGDIVFAPEILNLILQDNSNNKISVNNSEVGEEEIKYNIDTDSFIKKLSKTVPQPLGEAVGINFIKKEDIKNLKESLNKCEDSDYFERGIEYCIERGIKFAPMDIKDNFCIEIDFKEDLNTANKYLENLNN